MVDTHENRPLSSLLGDLATDISMLFRKEVELAKAEATEKVSEVMVGVGSIAIGGVLILGALGVFLAALVSILATFLINQGIDPATANAIGAFVVAGVVGIAGWTTLSKGLATLKTGNLNLNRTATSLGRDTDLIKERL